MKGSKRAKLQPVVEHFAPESFVLDLTGYTKKESKRGGRGRGRPPLKRSGLSRQHEGAFDDDSAEDDQPKGDSLTPAVASVPTPAVKKRTTTPPQPLRSQSTAVVDSTAFAKRPVPAQTLSVAAEDDDDEEEEDEDQSSSVLDDTEFNRQQDHALVQPQSTSPTTDYLNSKRRELSDALIEPTKSTDENLQRLYAEIAAMRPSPHRVEDDTRGALYKCRIPVCIFAQFSSIHSIDFVDCTYSC